MIKHMLAAGALVGLANSAYAAAIVVPYSGSFDEASVVAEDGLPAGDYDTIGGLEDVGLFVLREGVNTFSGSIFAPSDPSDVFAIEIAPGLSLVDASINWGTNLPGLASGFPPPPGYLEQPDQSSSEWTLEDSDPTPEIFTIGGLTGSNSGTEPELRSAGALSVGPGIYSSTLRNVSATCAQTHVVSSDGFLTPTCVEGIDYTISFTVDGPGDPEPGVIPLPAGGLLLVSGLALFGMMRRRFV